MTDLEYSLEEIGPNQLVAPGDSLSPDELATLWRVLGAIEAAWDLTPISHRLKRQWDDMIEARCQEPNSYYAEFKNAVGVLNELSSMIPAELSELVFFQTIIREPSDAKTRLDHAKYFVVNDFISFLILSGGFQQFGARNYKGFMRGSRFADISPVRTGDRL